MKSTDDQGLIPVIVASEADTTYIRAIPTAQPTAGDGSVSLDLGLPPECATAVAAGGKRPEMKDMNGIWNLFSRAIQSLQAYRGVYSASFATAIGGYPKYAMVSDSSGNFWISTADANTTTPGATGANWQSLFNGYATEAWANKAFVKNSGGTNGGVVSATIDASVGQPSFLDGAGTWHVVQPYGSYATTAQLNAEITRATTVEGNLQSSKVNRSGDTMTGGLTIDAAAGLNVAYDPGGQTSGAYVNYGGIYSAAGTRGGAFGIYVQEHVGFGFNGVISVTYPSGQGYRTIGIPQSNRISDSLYGDVAYTSDLANYQPKGNYQPAGSYVTTDVYTSDFSTSDTRVINLAYGHRIQAFTITVDGNGTNSHRITYPVAFSGASSVAFVGNDTSQSRSVSLSNNTTPDSTGFNISVSVHGNSTAGSTDGLTLSVIAVGPK